MVDFKLNRGIASERFRVKSSRTNQSSKNRGEKLAEQQTVRVAAPISRRLDLQEEACRLRGELEGVEESGMILIHFER